MLALRNKFDVLADARRLNNINVILLNALKRVFGARRAGLNEIFEEEDVGERVRNADNNGGLAIKTP